MAGREVGRRTGLFLVPDIVSFDDARGEIVFQRLPLTALLHHADLDRTLELAERAAAALAAIHDQMVSSEPARTHPGGMGVGSSRAPVPLHGDFALPNVLYLSATGQLVIIDWSDSDWTGVDADLGAPEIDVAVFLMSLFHRRAFGPWRAADRREVARQFLATYAATARQGLDLDALRDIVAAVTPRLNRFLRHRKGIRALGYRHGMIDLDFFLRRMSGEELAGTRHAAERETMERSRSTVPYTDRHKARGSEYHESFSPDVNPYRAMVWRLEQRALDRMLRDRLAPGTVKHLDFACGTGRILEHFLPRVASATGVDVSASMMKVAAQVAPGAELIEADLTKADVLGERTFDLITAFRFFPNAEPELRSAIFRVLARHLAPGGVLVFNNHKNRNSLRRRISRLLGREVARGTMTHAEVEALVGAAGLRIVGITQLASLPVSENHPLLPVALVEPIERRLSRLTALAPIAQDVIYLCARAQA